MNSPTFNTHTNRDELTKTLVGVIIDHLCQGIEVRGRASLVVSGGNTPIPLFQELASHDLPWEKIDITLADERWVATDSIDSNEHVVREHLLQGPASAARFVGLKNNALTPFEGEQTCTKHLNTISTPYDVVLLGMGFDGHTASLYPEAPELEEALALTTAKSCIQVTPPYAQYWRMTQTLSKLLDARQIFLFIIGWEKYHVYSRAAAGTNDATMPIRAFLHQEKVPIAVFWAQ